MKRLSLLSLGVATLLFTACGTTESSSQENAFDDDASIQEAITTTTNTLVVTSSNPSIHYQGESCAKCHSLASSASWFDAPRRDDAFEENENEENENEENENENEENENENEGSDNVFTSGATLFAELHASDSDAKKAAYGYTLRLLLDGGEVQKYYSGRGTGNFNGTFNAGIDKYTAQVLDAKGNVVNTSVTNSHDASRFDCNSCHSSAGSSGAPGRIVAYSFTTPTVVTATETTVTEVAVTTPTTPSSTPNTPVEAPTLSFAKDVEPILNAKCKSCHGDSGNFSITNSTTPYSGVVPFVDTNNASASSLLQKGSGIVGHAGGAVFTPNGSEYITIRDWIAAGALNN